MTKTAIEVGNIVFACSVEQTQDQTWRATVSLLSENVDGNARLLEAVAPTEDLAVSLLQRKIRQSMTVAASSLSAGQLALVGLNWVWRAPSLGRRIVRAASVGLMAAVLVPFFIDFTGGTSTIAGNMRFLARTLTHDAVRIPDKGFLNEKFIAAALRSAKHEFWASGVSFRNLVAGNRAVLDSALQRGVRVRIVLLDPNSPLADDAFIARFSRTAKRDDIQKTIAALSGADGILPKFGHRGQDELWISPYAPIVPMIRVDDRLLTGPLVHVDRKMDSNAYDGWYVDLNAGSPLGQELLAHFNAMLSDPAAQRIAF